MLFECHSKVFECILNRLSNDFGVDWNRKSIQTSFKVDKNGFWIVLKWQHQSIGLLFKWHSKIYEWVLNRFQAAILSWTDNSERVQNLFKVIINDFWIVFKACLRYAPGTIAFYLKTFQILIWIDFECILKLK